MLLLTLSKQHANTSFSFRSPKSNIQVHGPIAGRIYSPLPPGSCTIRSIELIPGDWTTGIQCRLYDTHLASSGSYKALSYTWGNLNATLSVFILCNGQRLPIPSNLSTALRRLRQPDRPAILWVDALCINQSDDTERAHQVGIMRDIYENSCEMVIWLGEQSVQDDVGRRYLDIWETGVSLGSSCNQNTLRMEWHDGSRDERNVRMYMKE